MDVQDRFAGLTEFVTTVRLGSFAAAARELGVTGSAVGKSVTRLEARLGTKLLHRTTRRLTLTGEGQVYLDACQRILDDLDGTELAMASGRDTPVGTLHLNLPAAFGRRHVMPILLELTAQYRHLDLSVMFTERTANVIEEGIDLAVRIGTLGNDADLTARRLGTQRLLICASPDYLARHGAPRSPEELTQRDCIIGWRRVPRPVWLLKDKAGGEVAQEVKVRHEFSDGEAILAAALAGEGLAQLPDWLIEKELASGALVPVLEECAGAEMPIHLVWPSSRYEQPRLRIVIDALAAAAQLPGSGFTPGSRARA
ncbi:MAG: LysR family transcriptional regulator [Pseudomonadota bacterium]|nr:LysR family transcriptional regulator [Pseudomonadota bacterium]